MSHIVQESIVEPEKIRVECESYNTGHWTYNGSTTDMVERETTPVEEEKPIPVITLQETIVEPIQPVVVTVPIQPVVEPSSIETVVIQPVVNIEPIQPVLEFPTHKTQTITYSELVKIAKPFDIVFFRGTDVVSDAIAFMEQKQLGEGSYSHVGMIITSDLFPHPSLKQNKLYVWESTMSMSLMGITDGTPDVISNEGKFGVQIRSLQSVMKSYLSGDEAKIAWGRLINNPWDTNKSKCVEEFQSIHEQYGNATYDANCIDLLAALFPWLRCLRTGLRKVRYAGRKAFRMGESSEWLFCSEAIAIVYKKIGVISPQTNVSDVVPVDFLGVDQDGLPRLVDSPVQVVNDV